MLYDTFIRAMINHGYNYEESREEYGTPHGVELHPADNDPRDASLPEVRINLDAVNEYTARGIPTDVMRTVLQFVSTPPDQRFPVGNFVVVKPSIKDPDLCDVLHAGPNRNFEWVTLSTSAGTIANAGDYGMTYRDLRVLPEEFRKQINTGRCRVENHVVQTVTAI